VVRVGAELIRASGVLDGLDAGEDGALAVEGRYGATRSPGMPSSEA
jgi:hypothetical protein